MSESAIFGRRLKETRERLGLSQKKLGIAAGLDPSVASTRINRYELGIHQPDHQFSARLAAVLDVPGAYLHADDDLAPLIGAWGRLDGEGRAQLTDYAEQMALYQELHRALPEQPAAKPKKLAP